VGSPRLPRYISLSDAAQVLVASEKTIRRFIASGELPGYTLGRRGPGSGRPIRARLGDVEALLRRIPTAGDDRPGQTPL
jgi:excisionase family DNA binding protein